MVDKLILIVKHGALGDVVRTSYFPKYIKESNKENTLIHWWTSKSALELLRLNPFIDKIITDDKEITLVYDEIYSLDDEDHILEKIERFNFKKLYGLTKKNGQYKYCKRTEYWFDMGLRSKYGKAEADLRKRTNEKTHTEIFSKIFNVDCTIVKPQFYNSIGYERPINVSKNQDLIGINPYAGGRWKSKELPEKELHKLLRILLNKTKYKVILLGGFEDFKRNVKTVQKFESERLFTVNTDESLLKLAGIIRNLEFLISSDSLALHLAIANNIKSISFYSPTSASEIDIFENGHKIISKAEDYCSYTSNTDNSTITADRILEKIL